uniref:VWFA domain-containing protein n=1 Tax=Trachysalambria curvirostris majanivirus TaxID=2984281 RepID=A0A9C7BMT3_9VIRU|nr:MAG: hypothetical protein [Trachysalambria curvirostris majanivirus]
MKMDDDIHFKVFKAEEYENGIVHTFLQVPTCLPCIQNDDIYNILMVDASSSMHYAVPHIVDGWNENIRPILKGRTRIYSFATKVKLLESDSLRRQDLIYGGSTNLTSALNIIRHEVDNCSESNICIFLITDGDHNVGGILPDIEIEKMKPPLGKNVNVYLLGVGQDFPVRYSIDIRSRLHNGNSNIPSLFWANVVFWIEAECVHDVIIREMKNIKNELMKGIMANKLSHNGYSLPGLYSKTDVYPGEWIYFSEPPIELKDLSMIVNGKKILINCDSPGIITADHLLNDIFRQWNSIIIQQDRKNEKIPDGIFILMETLFNKCCDDLMKDDNKRDNIGDLKEKYNSLITQNKKIITRNKFMDEIELAETILKTTVTTSKYDKRNLIIKGRNIAAYDRDIKNFKNIYEQIKPKIMSLPNSTPDELCSITQTSTVEYLKENDIDFNVRKFDFMKTFPITGIPAYAPIKDASQINPWTMVIKHILVSPYAVLSQQVLEGAAEVDVSTIGKRDKDYQLQTDNDKTVFNIIIPIIPANAIDTLKPLLKSDLYMMMTTLCILKNPHIIEYNAHLAALGCAWIKTLCEFPIKSRPEYASVRLDDIARTAKIYLDRPSVKHYIDLLSSEPNQALMTESIKKINGKTLKCESLIKPMFLLSLVRENKGNTQSLRDILKIILLEFIGRCLSKYKTNECDATSYKDFFYNGDEDIEDKLNKHKKETVKQFELDNNATLENFYTINELKCAIKKYVTGRVNRLSKELKSCIKITLNIDKIYKLRQYASCGNIMWSTIKSWAEEMDIHKDIIHEAFSLDQVELYVYHALKYRDSKQRLYYRKILPSNDLHQQIKSKITQELIRNYKNELLSQIEKDEIKKWKERYSKIHYPMIMPMTKEQIIDAAQKRGIRVYKETFEIVYKRYDPKLMLLREACQSSQCPHFLVPHRNFNQHLEVDREKPNFAHCLHKVTSDSINMTTDDIIKKVASGYLLRKRNERLPKPPSLSYLRNRIDEIDNLNKIYKKMKLS